MVQSKALPYALHELADPLHNKHLLADPRLGPRVGGIEHEAEAATCQ